MTMSVGSKVPDTTEAFAAFYQLEGDATLLALLRGKHSTDASADDQHVRLLHPNWQAAGLPTPMRALISNTHTLPH